MSKFTKGPWLESIVETLDGERRLMVGRFDGVAVAEIRTQLGEAEANANLIASAPEMFDTLKALDGFSLSTHVAHNGEDIQLRQLVDRTIAHAEGREI